MEKKSILLAVTAALLLFPILAAAQPYEVTITFRGPDGAAVPNATVLVLNASGATVAKGITDQQGTVAFTLNAGSYLLRIENGYVVLYPLSVAGNTSIVVDASIMPRLVVESTPLLVEFQVTVEDVAIETSLKTNVTVYRTQGSTLTLTFPDVVKKWGIIPYKLVNITYGNTATTNNTVTLPPENYVVVAFYALTLPAVEPWMVAAAVILIILVIILLASGGRGAKQAIEEHGRRFVTKANAFIQNVNPETTRRFVKRRGI